MTRFGRGRGGIRSYPLGLTAGFMPRGTAAIGAVNPLSSTNPFSFQRGAIGTYMNPYNGKNNTLALCHPYQQCCTINGTCSTQATAYERATCLIHLFNIMYLVILVVSVINLASNSDKTLILVASLIEAILSFLFILLNCRVYLHRKNLFQIRGTVNLAQCLTMVIPSFVTVPCIMLAVFSHQQYDCTVTYTQQIGTQTQTYKQQNSSCPWSTATTLVLLTGLATAIGSIFFFTTSTCGYFNWLVHPKVLEANGNKVCLAQPIFAADVQTNPSSFNLLLNLVNTPVAQLNQENYRFSYDQMEQAQLFGVVIRQRARMITEMNSLIDGSAARNPMAGILAVNPRLALNPAIVNMMSNPAGAITNPHMVTFSPLMTDDFQVAKLREINHRLLSWKGTIGFFSLGAPVPAQLPAKNVYSNDVSINMNQQFNYNAIPAQQVHQPQPPQAYYGNNYNNGYNNGNRNFAYV